MKKTKHKPPSLRKPTRSSKKSPPPAPAKDLSKIPLPKPYPLLFLLLLFTAIGLKIYKADHTGIGYDESITFFRFCDSLYTATHDFSSTNNHLLNSIFIVFTRKLFSFYEHFIRIPSLTAGILFTIALALIVSKLFTDRFLKLSALALVLFVPFVFDYSFLARGYAFALAGIFINLALVIWLLDHPIRYRYRFVPVLIISLMNFLTFGAMLSTFLILTAFNLTFIFLFSHKIFSDSPNRIRPVLFSLVSITLLTTGLLYALYHPILSDILDSKLIQKFSKEWDDWNSFAEMIRAVLFTRVFRPIGPIGPLQHAPFIILMILLAAAALFHLVTAAKHLASKKLKKLLPNPTPQSLIIVFTILTLVLMFVYGVLLDKSLGRERNNVFIIPLVILSALVCIDRFAGSLPRSPALALRILMSVLLLTVAARNLPSPFQFGGHTLSGPLLRQLKEIDPAKTWKIGFSERRRLNYAGILYYDQFDYKFRLADYGYYFPNPGPFDIWICRLPERPPNLPCLNYNYFKKFGVAVVVNTPLPSHKVTFNKLNLPDNKTVLNAQLTK